jgi:hypothetical protein
LFFAKAIGASGKPARCGPIAAARLDRQCAAVKK